MPGFGEDALRLLDLDAAVERFLELSGQPDEAIPLLIAEHVARHHVGQRPGGRQLVRRPHAGSPLKTLSVRRTDAQISRGQGQLTVDVD